MAEPIPHFDPEFSHPNRQPNDLWRFLFELIKTAVIVAVLAYGIRAFILQPFVVEGQSMYPQLHDRDYLLVDKVSYHVHGPARGDIIVFKYPKDESYNYVKRVIGLPGERIKIENSTVTIYNSDHPDGFVINEPYVSAGNKTELNPTSTSDEFVVPADSYFVMGDNRMGSSDSREWGELPKKDLIGKVLIQAFPLSRFSLDPHAKY